MSHDELKKREEKWKKRRKALQDPSPTNIPPVVWISLLVVGACLWMKFLTAGLLFFLGGEVVYSGLCIVHFLVHYRSRRNLSGRRIVLMALSHLFFITGFLLQWDGLDGPEWRTLTALLGNRGAPEWWPLPASFSFLVSGHAPPWLKGGWGYILIVLLLPNLVFFVPAFLTYIPIFRSQGPSREGNDAPNSPANH